MDALNDTAAPDTPAQRADAERQRLQQQVDILNDDIASLRGIGRRWCLTIGEGSLELIESDDPEWDSLLLHLRAGLDTLDACEYLFAKGAAYHLIDVMELIETQPKEELQETAARFCRHAEGEASCFLAYGVELPVSERLRRIAGPQEQ